MAKPLRYLESQGYRKVGIVKTDNQYIDAILAGLQAAGGPVEIEVVDNYLPADQDFRSTVSKLKTSKFDALGVFLLSGQVSQFANQLRTQSIAIPLFGTDFFESLTEVRESNGGLAGAVFANNEVTDRFRERYTQRFGNDLQINHAANGYDFAKLICQQLGTQLHGKAPQEIVETVAQVDELWGEQGKAVFTTSSDGDRYFKFPVVIRKIAANRIYTEQGN